MYIYTRKYADTTVNSVDSVFDCLSTISLFLRYITRTNIYTHIPIHTIFRSFFPSFFHSFSIRYCMGIYFCVCVCLSMYRQRSLRKYKHYIKHIERRRTLHTFITFVRRTCYILLSLSEKYATSSKLSI